MMSIKKIIGIGCGVIILLIALMIFPINELLDKVSNSAKSPSPMEILVNNNDEILAGFEIIPVGCTETDSGLTQSHFQIRSSHNNDYGLKIGILFTDNEAVFYEEEVDAKILAGQTVDQVHLSDKVYENPVCVIQINDWYGL